MPGKPDQPHPSPTPGAPARDEQIEQPDARTPVERFGPVTIARHRKDDGRALILYARAESDRA
jgi:hypothetical protein